MHPNNWAMAQGHMLGTGPHPFFSLPADGSFLLAPLEETRGSPACECDFTVSSAAQSSQSKTQVFLYDCPVSCCEKSVGLQICAHGHATPVGLAPLCRQAALSALVPRRLPSLL